MHLPGEEPGCGVRCWAGGVRGGKRGLHGQSLVSQANGSGVCLLWAARLAPGAADGRVESLEGQVQAQQQPVGGREGRGEGPRAKLLHPSRR